MALRIYYKGNTPKGASTKEAYLSVTPSKLMFNALLVDELGLKPDMGIIFADDTDKPNVFCLGFIPVDSEAYKYKAATLWLANKSQPGDSGKALAVGNPKPFKVIAKGRYDLSEQLLDFPIDTGANVALAEIFKRDVRFYQIIIPDATTNS